MSRRSHDALRPLTIRPHCVQHPEGSALIAFGDTQVLCTASVEERVPPWLHGKGRGWVTGEYDMLPRATSTRNSRDSHRGKINGRTQEIGRLIGRSLRGAVNLQALGERTITVDCDVLQADGGTRTAAITGGWVALALAIKNLQERRKLKENPLIAQIAAVSVGLLEEGAQLDLDYSMDARAHVDLNVVFTADKNLVEIQGTGEKRAFSREELNTMLTLVDGAQATLLLAQQEAVQTPYNPSLGLMSPTP